MAEYQLDVQERASIQAWKDKAEQLNKDAQRAVNEAADALNEFKNTAEGNVFEQVCEYSGQIISGMADVATGMLEIINAIENLMNLIQRTGQALVEGVAGVVGKIFG